MKTKPYWLDTAPDFTSAAEGAPPGHADVAIIGGGFSGLSAALAFARKGASVVLLEAEQVLGAASGRNGGHCNNGLAHDFATISKQLGLEKARTLYQAFDAAVDTVERLVGEESIDCDFRRSGKLKLASKPSHCGGLKRSWDLLSREVDADTALLSAEDLPAEIGSSQFHGALLYKRSAMLHVGRFGIGLAEAAARQGAQLFEGVPVTAMTRRGSRGYELTTPKGKIKADQVLLASGAYTSGPFGYFRRRIIPVGSFIIATEPLEPSLLDSIMPTRRTATTTKHVGNYFRISPDDRLIFGGRARFAVSNPQSDKKSGVILRQTVEGVFPQLTGVKIDYCWGGMIDMSTDRLPRAGEQDGLFYTMGYSGHGVQMSVHMGQIMAEVMTGQPGVNPWKDQSWPAIPGHFGKPWFLPFVGAYYRTLDLIS